MKGAGGSVSDPIKYARSSNIFIYILDQDHLLAALAILDILLIRITIKFVSDPIKNI